MNIYRNSNYYNYPYYRENSIIKDYGNFPFVININDITRLNNNFRSTLWTGKNAQVTLMDIPVGEDIGFENHQNTDQILVIIQGVGLVQMGKQKGINDFQKQVYDNSIIIVPENTWHNVTNIGSMPLKLYSIYAPPNHKKGTIHKTKKDAEKEKY